MQGQPTSVPYESTPTPGVYRRGDSYTVKWYENGRRTQRTFSSYERACEIKRALDTTKRRSRKEMLAAVPMPRRCETGWVYFFQCDGGNREVKIGWSRDPAERLRSLSRGHAYGLTVVALIPGDEKLERDLHRVFRRWRLGGEWFKPAVVAELVKRIEPRRR